MIVASNDNEQEQHKNVLQFNTDTALSHQKGQSVWLGVMYLGLQCPRQAHTHSVYSVGGERIEQVKLYIVGM